MVLPPRALASLCCPRSRVSARWDRAGARAGDTDRADRKLLAKSSSSRMSGRCWLRTAIPVTATKKQKGGLRLDSLEAILKGGESGPAVVPGKPEESLLVSAINYAGPEMPPDGKLAPEKVAVLTRWVASGARWPRGDRAAHAAINSATAARRRVDRGRSGALVAAAGSRVQASGALRARGCFLVALAAKSDRSVYSESPAGPAV